METAAEFFKRHKIPVEQYSLEQRVELWQRLQKIPIGEGVANHLSAIYRTTVELDSCFAYTKAEMGIYSEATFDIELMDATPYAA